MDLDNSLTGLRYPAMGDPVGHLALHVKLAGIQERVESLGGSYRQESRPNQGFTIFVHLPASVDSATSETLSQAA